MSAIVIGLISSARRGATGRPSRVNNVLEDSLHHGIQPRRIQSEHRGGDLGSPRLPIYSPRFVSGHVSQIWELELFRSDITGQVPRTGTGPVGSLSQTTPVTLTFRSQYSLQG